MPLIGIRADFRSFANEGGDFGDLVKADGGVMQGNRVKVSGGD
jgi:hypothetical protein